MLGTIYLFLKYLAVKGLMLKIPVVYLSQLFVTNNIDSVNVFLRKAVFSLMSQLRRAFLDYLDYEYLGMVFGGGRSVE